MFSGTSLTRVVSGLLVYTEYEFQVLAFSSKGDGPKSSVVFERTKEDGKITKEWSYLARLYLHLRLNILLPGGVVHCK